MIDVKFPLKKDDSGEDSVDSYGSERTNDASGRGKEIVCFITGSF